MYRLQHQDTYDPVELVQKYIQDTAPADDIVISEGNLEHLFSKVKHLFTSILSLVKPCDSDFKDRIQNNSLDRSYSRLVLWYDAYQLLLGTEKGDIPSDLADEATKYLKSIGLILVDRLILLLSKASVRLEIDSLEGHVLDVSSWIQKVGNLGDDDGSDTSSNFDYDSYADVAEDLKTDTVCLMGVNTLLSTALNAPGVDTAWDTTMGRWEPYQPYCDRISNRFPYGIESLIVRLGKANYERYLRCIQKREEDHDDQNDDRADTVVASDFHDSGLGSSIPGKSTYAETVMSYGGDGSEQTVRVPPLSAEARQGKPFTCIACSRTVTISNNSLWKRHLYEDLRPWLCLEPTCSSGSSVFSRRDDWVAHLAFEHHFDPAWEALQCPLCRDHIESGKASVTRHLGGHLEEIALGSLPVQTESENDSEDGSLPSTPITGSMKVTRSSVASQTNVSINRAEAATTDLPPPLPCASSYSPTYSLQQDMPESPSSERLKCPYCEKEFTRLIDLGDHMIIHPSETLHVCDICQMIFGHVNDLKRHSKLHLHVCETCGWKFAHEDALDRHNKGPGGCISRGISMYEDDVDRIPSSARFPEIHQQFRRQRDSSESQHSNANNEGSPVPDIVLPTFEQSYSRPSDFFTMPEPSYPSPNTTIETPYRHQVTNQSPHSNMRPTSEIPFQVFQFDPNGPIQRTSRARMPSGLLGPRRNALQGQHPREHVAIDANGNILSRYLSFGANERVRRAAAAPSWYRRMACLHCKTSKQRCQPSENNPLGPCKRCIQQNRECDGRVLAPPAFDTPSKPPSDGDRTSERRSDVDIVGEKITPSSSPSNELHSGRRSEVDIVSEKITYSRYPSHERHSDHVVSDEPSSPLRSLPTYDAPEQHGHERTSPMLE